MSAEGFRSYKSLFRIKFKIYAIGNRPLPRPVPVDIALIYLALLLPSYFIAKPVAEMFATSPLLVGLVVDGVITWALGRADPQGQPLPYFLLNIVTFFLQKRRRDFTGKPVAVKKKHRLDWQCLNLETKKGKYSRKRLNSVET